ncbi:MAG: tRNA (guanosine(37)-N1)-methyltransferase TrmD [Neisseriaceae bacterium]|nr:tRNA (guanosine(37)-N1)-methyltransferase TrmD [Neisseriaceae bacterium]
MLVQVITLFGEMFSAITEYGVTGRAAKNGLWRLETLNPRQFADNRLGYIDDKPFGGGAGMVMQAPPIQAALNVAFAKAGTQKAIYLSPQGVPLTHDKTLELSQQNHLILLCGRYEGIDERILQANDIEEISVGDFVVSGGELPAMMLIDAVLRHRPNVLGDEQSAQQDSFCGGLLDYPHYTRPVEFNGLKVPDVLLSGNHQEIAKWRHTQSLLRTKERRPDLWVRHSLTPQEIQLLQESNGESILD